MKKSGGGEETAKTEKKLPVTQKENLKSGVLKTK